MVTVVVNLALIATVIVCVHIAWRANLFECALLLGRSFFAFFVALGLSGPVADLLQESFPLPLPYLEAVVCFVLWAAVFVAVQRLANSAAGGITKEMIFHGPLALPGKVVSGLVSGFLVSALFSVVLVMIPAIEGAYVEADSQVIGGLHKKAASLYAAVDVAFGSEETTAAGILRRTQVRAGVWWAKSALRKDRSLKGEELAARMAARYGGVADPKTIEELREFVRKGGLERRER